MGKRFKKRFHGVCCFRKKTNDSSGEEDGEAHRAPAEDPTNDKLTKTPRDTSRLDLEQIIADTEVHLAKSIQELYARVDDDDILYTKALNEYLATHRERENIVTATNPESVKDTRVDDDDTDRLYTEALNEALNEYLASHREHENNVTATNLESVKDTNDRSGIPPIKIDRDKHAYDRSYIVETQADNGPPEEVEADSNEIRTDLVRSEDDKTSLIVVRQLENDDNVTLEHVDGESNEVRTDFVRSEDDNTSVKVVRQLKDVENVVRDHVTYKFQQESGKLSTHENDSEVSTVVDHAEANGPLSLQANAVSDKYIALDKVSISECSLEDTTGADICLKKTRFKSLATRTDTNDIATDTSDLVYSGDKFGKIKDEIKLFAKPQDVSTKHLSRHRVSVLDTMLDKAIKEVTNADYGDKDSGEGKINSTCDKVTVPPFTSNTVLNVSPFRYYCRRVSVPETGHEGGTPYRGPSTNRRSNGRLSRFNLAFQTDVLTMKLKESQEGRLNELNGACAIPINVPAVVNMEEQKKHELSEPDLAMSRTLSETNIKQTKENKLSRLVTTVPTMWSNQTNEEDFHLQRGKIQNAPIEVECLGISVPASGTILDLPSNVPTVEIDENDDDGVDVDLALDTSIQHVLKQKYDYKKAVKAQYKAPAITNTSNLEETPSSTVLPLKMLCAKMFTVDENSNADQNESGLARQQLTIISLLHINEALQRVKTNDDNHSETQMLVRPLRNLCGHLFGTDNAVGVETYTNMNNEDNFVDDFNENLDDSLHVDGAFEFNNRELENCVATNNGANNERSAVGAETNTNMEHDNKFTDDFDENLDDRLHVEDGFEFNTRELETCVATCNGANNERRAVGVKNMNNDDKFIDYFDESLIDSLHVDDAFELRTSTRELEKCVATNNGANNERSAVGAETNKNMDNDENVVDDFNENLDNNLHVEDSFELRTSTRELENCVATNNGANNEQSAVGAETNKNMENDNKFIDDFDENLDDILHVEDGFEFNTRELETCVATCNGANNERSAVGVVTNTNMNNEDNFVDNFDENLDDSLHVDGAFEFNNRELENCVATNNGANNERSAVGVQTNTNMNNEDNFVDNFDENLDDSLHVDGGFEFNTRELETCVATCSSATEEWRHLDYNAELESEDCMGYFGSSVDPIKKSKSEESVWEEWTDPPEVNIEQLEDQNPELEPIPRVDLALPKSSVNLRNLMDRFMNSAVFKEDHARFLCVNILRKLKQFHLNDRVHSSITPGKVVFNESGYPFLMPNIVTPSTEPRIEYASPEEITSGPITIATDIFQTGLLVYLLMYGRSPYKAPTPSTTKNNILNDEFIPQFENGAVSKDGRYFIRKCLKKDPEERFKLSKCKKVLPKAVKWFNVYTEEELASETYPSPFKDLVGAVQSFPSPMSEILLSDPTLSQSSREDLDSESDDESIEWA